MSKKTKYRSKSIYYILSKDIDTADFQVTEVQYEKVLAPEELKQELYKTDEFSKQEIIEVFKEAEISAYVLKSKPTLEPL
jgi:hypothetical protein